MYYTAYIKSYEKKGLYYFELFLNPKVTFVSTSPHLQKQSAQTKFRYVFSNNNISNLFSSFKTMV